VERRLHQPGCRALVGEVSSYQDKPGIWVLYDYDNGPYVIQLFDDVVPAAREQAQQGFGRVAFCPFGMSIRDAIKWWEKREGTTDVLTDIEKIKWTVLEILNSVSFHTEALTDRAEVASCIAINVYEKHMKEN